MIKLYKKYARHRRSLIAWLSVTTSTLALIGWLPKDATSGATSRLKLLIAFAAVSIAGAIGIAVTSRQRREARLKLRFDDAPRPMQAALRYLLDERRLSRRGMLVSVLVAASAGYGWLIVQWPQASAARGLHTLLATVSIAGMVAACLAPIWHRGHYINSRFLAQYMRQQARFAVFQPMTLRKARLKIKNLVGPPVKRVKDSVRAGGFEWQWQDFTKGMLVLGQPGAGKTNTVLSTILHMLFEMLHDRGFSAFVQDVKGDFRQPLSRLCASYGLTDRLFMFDLLADPESRGTREAIVINPLDVDEPALEVVASIIAAFVTLGLKANESFFLDSVKMFMTQMLILLRAGLPEDEPPSIEHFPRLALELSQAEEHVTADGEVISNWPFFDSLCVQIQAGRAGGPLATPIAEALDYVFQEFVPMPDRQRAGITGTLRQISLDMMSEPARHFMTGRTTISMGELIDRNAILYVHAPEAINPRQSLMANLVIRAAMQRAIRRRPRKASPSFFMCDEFHNLWAPGTDSQFFSLSRESNHSNIVALQNLPLIFQKTQNKNEVFSVLGNLAVKLFMRNTEAETNAFASKLFGEMSSIVVSPSESARFGEAFRRNTTNYARSTATVPVVSAETFTTLAVPTDAEPFAETIVHLATRKETQRLRLFWKVHPL